MKSIGKSIIVIVLTVFFFVVLTYILSNNDVAEIPYIYLDF